MARGIRSPRTEAERQIKYFEAMKRNATAKYAAKMDEYNRKIETLTEKLPTLSNDVSPK